MSLAGAEVRRIRGRVREVDVGLIEVINQLLHHRHQVPPGRVEQLLAVGDEVVEAVLSDPLVWLHEVVVAVQRDGAQVSKRRHRLVGELPFRASEGLRMVAVAASPMV